MGLSFPLERQKDPRSGWDTAGRNGRERGKGPGAFRKKGSQGQEWWKVEWQAGLQAGFGVEVESAASPRPSVSLRKQTFTGHVPGGQALP